MKKQNLIVIVFLAILVAVVSLVMLKNRNANTQSTNKQTADKKILAGTSSPYLEFNQMDYKNTLQSGKIVFLDFYANWCPVCRAETPYLREGFDALSTDKVVGFRVNWQDDQTDDDEKNLAAQFKVLSQHTKIILKDGKEIFRTVESWDKQTFIKQINSIL